MSLRVLWAGINLVVSILVCAPLTILARLIDSSYKYTMKVARMWARWALWGTGSKIRVEGMDKLVPGTNYIFMSNHTSALDVLIPLAYLPGIVVYMAKKELFGIPLFGWALYAAGSIPVNRSNRAQARASVDKAAYLINKRSVSIIFYPEGTRSRDGKLGPFKGGGFYLAVASKLAVVPVVIQGADKVMPPDTLSLTPGDIKVTITKPIETADLDYDERHNLLEQTRNSIQSILDEE
jgi:1-acyl-sn-glycerol-3-phosphate acyltransferase